MTSLENPSDITKAELALAADMLELAAEAFSYNGCNDHSIPDTPTNRIIARSYYVRSAPDGPPEEWEPREYNGGIFVTDFGLMNYLAWRLRQIAETQP